MSTTGCQHPADKDSTEALLHRCPDCGAECSETSIGDDDLCYDEACPLHALAGPVPRAYRIYFGGASDVRPAIGAEVLHARFGELLVLTSAPGRIQTNDPRGNYRVALCIRAERDVTALSEAEFDALPEASPDAE